MFERYANLAFAGAIIVAGLAGIGGGIGLGRPDLYAIGGILAAFGALAASRGARGAAESSAADEEED